MISTPFGILLSVLQKSGPSSCVLRATTASPALRRVPACEGWQLAELSANCRCQRHARPDVQTACVALGASLSVAHARGTLLHRHLRIEGDNRPKQRFQNSSTDASLLWTLVSAVVYTVQTSHELSQTFDLRASLFKCFDFYRLRCLLLCTAILIR
jgi:hypothetical protein